MGTLLFVEDGRRVLDQAMHMPASIGSAKWFTSVIHSVSYAPTTLEGPRRFRTGAVGTGGFAGVGRHDVAIPVRLIQLQDDGKFVLPGATAAIKSLPRFEYAKNERE